MPAQPQLSLTAYRLIGSEFELLHHSYVYEKQLLHALLYSEEAELSALLKAMTPESGGRMAATAEKQEEYSCVLLISMLIRGAMEAGMDPLEAYAMNDIYLQRLSVASGVAEYSEIRSAFFQEFTTTLRRRLAEKGTSVYTERAKQYIRQNLTKKLTLDEIAGYAGISPNRLSSLFTKAEKISMREFILREKANAAAELLRLTRMSIGTIAETLCFSSQSHFGSVFLRIMGETPSAYRNAHFVP